MRYLVSVLFLNFGFVLTSQEVLTLESVVSKVLENNFSVRIERNTQLISQNENNIGNAGYLPTLELNAEQGWSNNNTRQQFFSGQVNQATSAKNNSTSAALRMNWTFFDGFKMFATDKRLQLQEDLAGINLSAEMEMKIYQASVLFYTILQQQSFEPVLLQALDLSRTRYELTSLKVKNGSQTPLQLIQARMDLTADSASYLQYQKQLNDLKTDLNTLMGQKNNSGFLLEGTFLNPKEITLEEAMQEARNQNTELLMAKSAIAVAAMQRKETQSFYYPQLSFYAQYGFARSENQIGILNSSRSYGSGIGFTFKWTILDRLSTYTQLKNNNIQLENAKLVEEERALFIENELQKTFQEYLWAKNNLKLEESNIVNAGEILNIAQKTFENGSLAPIELREIQFSVIQAKGRLLSAQLALKTAELNIGLSTGNFKSLLK